MDANIPCQKCLDMGCTNHEEFPPFATYVGQWADGPSNQGPWCKCCATQLLDLIKNDSDTTMSTLAMRFLVTLAEHPDQYVREEPADPTGWSGSFPCWHPTNCRNMAKHVEKLKKSRSKFFSRISKELTGFDYAYWPYSYDQLSFSSPFPYIMSAEMAAIVLGDDGIDPAEYPSNPNGILPGGHRAKCPLDMSHS